MSSRAAQQGRRHGGEQREITTSQREVRTERDPHDGRAEEPREQRRNHAERADRRGHPPRLGAEVEDRARALVQREGEGRAAFLARSHEKGRDDRRASAEAGREAARERLGKVEINARTGYYTMAAAQ